MSHYAKINTQFKFELELVQALKDIYGTVEYHAVPKFLNGYEENHNRSANIIVRKKYAKTVYGDVGFLLNQNNGCYELIVDDLDLKHGRFDLGKLVSTYASKVIKNKLPKGKYRIRSTTDSEIKLQMVR